MIVVAKSESHITTPKKQPATPESLPKGHWISMYNARPSMTCELFELEAMVAKRMELLAWIDMQLTSQKTGNMTDVLRHIGDRLQQRRTTPINTPQKSALGSEDENAKSTPTVRWDKDIVTMTDEEDLISHLLCRFAFCMSEKWRKWFIRTEETLMRARYNAIRDRDKLPVNEVISLLLRSNGLPCEPLTEATAPPKLGAYIEMLRARSGTSSVQRTVADFVVVPLGLATRLVRDRQVLCHKGKAVLQFSQAHEVFLAVYRTQLARGLQDAYHLRNKSESMSNEEDAHSSMLLMLDAFLTRFVADPQDNLREMTEGVVRHQDIAGLAQTHFPLCMRRIDTSVREHGHLKHHGRLMYGLFLKAIGLSMEDSMTLFSNLMTVKGGASVESFAKSSYGYNVRYNYGKEGKKTNYSSFSCGTIIALPPMTDRIDCHGCPFKFRDEIALRQLLLRDQQHPYGPELPKICPSMSAIEDIVQDAKDQHYTRACYKYYLSTHPDAKRDSLFRSPFEYHVQSLESKMQYDREVQQIAQKRGESTDAASPSGGAKRSPAPFLREASKPRTE